MLQDVFAHGTQQKESGSGVWLGLERPVASMFPLWVAVSGSPESPQRRPPTPGLPWT